MKIAVLGNSNNIGFSIMRYFRDLGTDAELLLYANDGVGTHSHFSPENDTQLISRWEPFIKRTRISNHPMAALNDFESWCHHLPRRFYSHLKRRTPVDDRIGTGELIRLLNPYDRIVGNGIAPAACGRIGRSLDIFCPYSVGVEFIASNQFDVPKKETFFSRLLNSRARAAQERGVKAARHVLNAEVGYTEEILKRLGTQPKRLPLPMIYNRETIEPLALDPARSDLNHWLSTRRIKFFTSARMLWTETSTFSPEARKNNDWFFRALAKVKQQHPECSYGVVAMEYGPDVSATKRLIAELDLENDVYWLPLGSRASLMRVLSACDVAVGQFYEHPRTLWGGTGWEALSIGKPLLQGFLFEAGEFEAIFGYPPPAMYPVTDFNHLVEQVYAMVNNLGESTEIGLAGKEWFNRYNGIGLAKQWLDLL